MADLLTKALNSSQLRHLLSKMNVMNIHVSTSLPQGECTVLDGDRLVAKKIDADVSNRLDSYLERVCQSLKVNESISR